MKNKKKKQTLILAKRPNTIGKTDQAIFSPKSCTPLSYLRHATSSFLFFFSLVLTLPKKKKEKNRPILMLGVNKEIKVAQHPPKN